MVQLEKYKGTKSRHICPECNSRSVFVRYVTDDGSYLSETVGRCNRENKCGYHYKPKQFYADNPKAKEIGVKFGKGKKRRRVGYTFSDKSLSQTKEKPQTFDFIPFEHLKTTFGNLERNAFVQFLIDLFPNCYEEIQDILKIYFVGAYKGYTCFPQIDRQMQICKATLIRFDQANGKRRHGNDNTSSLVVKLNLKENFNYKQVFFGEHLLTRFADRPIAVVESQKSAIVGELCLPKMLWMATGSKQWLKAERLQRFAGRQIVLYPDADGYSAWQQIATNARRLGLDVKVSDLIETNATIEQKTEGFDIADYLIEQQRGINEYNEYIDAHNLGAYETDEQDLLDARLEREAVLEYENTVSA
jgi:hypothetical protein